MSANQYIPSKSVGEYLAGMCIGGTRGRHFLRVNQIPKPHTNIARAIESSEQIFSAFLSKGKRKKRPPGDGEISLQAERWGVMST